MPRRPVISLRLWLTCALPDTLHLRESRAIHGVLNRYKHHGVLPADDHAQIQKQIGLYFQKCARLERGIDSGRQQNKQRLLPPALNVARNRVAIWQLPDCRPAVLFQHASNYTVYRGQDSVNRYAAARFSEVKASLMVLSITDRSSEGDRFLT